MSGDDTTKDLSGDKGNTTQPMIGEVFKLLEQLKLSMEARFDEVGSRFDQTNARIDVTNARLDETNARLDETNARLDETNARLDETNARLDVTNTRLDEIESRLARDIEGVNGRVASLTVVVKELGYKIDALNRSRLQTEADYESLLDRIRGMESKAS